MSVLTHGSAVVPSLMLFELVKGILVQPARDFDLKPNRACFHHEFLLGRNQTFTGAVRPTSACVYILLFVAALV